LEIALKEKVFWVNEVSLDMKVWCSIYFVTDKTVQ